MEAPGDIERLRVTGQGLRVGYCPGRLARGMKLSSIVRYLTSCPFCRSPSFTLGVVILSSLCHSEVRPLITRLLDFFLFGANSVLASFIPVWFKFGIVHFFLCRVRAR